MKKAKLILAGIACMAIVGGAFAFKASRGTGILFYPTTTTTIDGATVYVCPPLKNATTTNVGLPKSFYTSTILVQGITVCTFPTVTIGTTVAL